MQDLPSSGKGKDEVLRVSLLCLAEHYIVIVMLFCIRVSFTALAF